MRRLMLAAAYAALALAFVLVPADQDSFLPGLPVDFRVAAPLLLAAGLAAVLGRPERWACVVLATLVLAKLVLWPATIQRGLVGTYYAAANFSGAVAQTQVDQRITFADGTFPLDFFNEVPRFNVEPPDRWQLPFSVRWQGVIVGQPRLVTNQTAKLRTRAGISIISFSKAWGPHASLQLVGATALYPHSYPSWRIALGNAVRIVQDVLALVFALALLPGLASVRLGWGSGLFLLIVAQGYVRTWPRAGTFPPLAAGQDWLTYASEARDIAQHGWLMNGGLPLFKGQPLYFQSFYAYFVALAHMLTGGSIGGVLFLQYVLLAATGALLCALASDVFGNGPAAVTALLYLWIEQKYLLQYADLLLTENLAYPLLAGGLLLYERTYVRTSIWLAGGAGVLLGLAADARATVLAFVGLAALGLLLFRRRSLLPFALAAAAALAIILARNWLASGQLVWLPAAGMVDLVVKHQLPASVGAGAGAAGRLLAAPALLLEAIRRRVEPGSLPVLGLPETWSWLGLTTDLGLFLLWPLLLAALALTRRKPFLAGRAALLTFVLTQLAANLTFGLLAYGMRITLMMYLLLLPFAAVALLAPFRQHQRLLLAALALFIAAGTAIPSALAAQASGKATAINADITLAGIQLPDQVAPGETFPAVLTWRVNHAPHASYTVWLHAAIDRTNRPIFVADGLPTALHPDHSRWDSTNPTATWQAGDLLRDVHQITVPATAPSGLYRLDIGLYSYRPRLTQERGHGSALFRIVRAAPQPGPTLADFGTLQLIGFAVDAQGVTLTWRDARPLATDETVFVHALDASGHLVAQNDAQPGGGNWPTSAWRPGQVVIDRHPLVIPPSARSVEVGLYQLKTGQRMPLVNGPNSWVHRLQRPLSL